MCFLHSLIRVQVDAIESIETLATRQSNAESEASAFEPKCRFTKNDLNCPICLVRCQITLSGLSLKV